jgi:hypothetical protein
MIIVRLDWGELAVGANIGVLRQVSALQRGRPDTYGYDKQTAWSIHADGALAEMALAKHLGVYWHPLAPDGIVAKMPGDVGVGVQVRSTTHLNGRLRTHPPDRDDHAFCLVICEAPRFHIAGWLYGHEAKRQEWWCDPTGKGRPAFFAPQAALRPIATLAANESILSPS